MGRSSSISCKEQEVRVAFDPGPTDVVSTKVRTWNKKYPGNIYYTSLVQRHAAELDSDNGTAQVRLHAEKIVHEIMVVRGGRFLKPPDGDLQPTECVNMNRANAIVKVIHALKTAVSKRDTRECAGDDGQLPKKKTKKINVDRNHPMAGREVAGTLSFKQAAPKSSTSMTPPLNRQSSRRSSSENLMYKAKAGTQKVPGHLLKLITAVCNQEEATTAHRVLDSPLGDVAPEDEPDQDRIRRLQIRHRFAGAAAMGMSPLEFSSKLLRLWGGQLIVTKRVNKRLRTPPTGKQTPGNSCTPFRGGFEPASPTTTQSMLQTLASTPGTTSAMSTTTSLTNDDTTAASQTTTTPISTTTLFPGSAISAATSIAGISCLQSAPSFPESTHVITTKSKSPIEPPVILS